MKNEIVLKNKYYIELDADLLEQTGEIKTIGTPIHAPEAEMKIPRGGFEIAYLASICDILDQLGNKKIKVLQYILKNKDAQNCLNETQVEIARKVGCSRQCVAETLSMLMDAGVLSKKNSVIRLSPKVVVKGDQQREAYLMRKFVEEKDAMSQPKVVADLKQQGIEGQLAFSDTDMTIHEEPTRYN